MKLKPPYGKIYESDKTKENLKQDVLVKTSETLGKENLNESKEEHKLVSVIDIEDNHLSPVKEIIGENGTKVSVIYPKSEKMKWEESDEIALKEKLDLAKRLKEEVDKLGIDLLSLNVKTQTVTENSTENEAETRELNESKKTLLREKENFETMLKEALLNIDYLVEIKNEVQKLKSEEEIVESEETENSQLNEQVSEGFIEQIKEGTKISYEDKVIGGIYTVEKLPNEENENKYVIKKDENGMTIKLTVGKLKEEFEKGKASLYLETKTEINMEASDIEHITRNVKAKVWGTPGVISIDLQKIINNEENINLSYPEAWEKVKAILSFPKDRLIKAIMVFERWAKNPAQKNLQYMGMACLSTLAEIMKIEKEIKPKLLKQEVGSNNK